ncbi:MAG: phosphate ABC transporter ATP-binding protein [Planctomycetota bacterium]|nr:phosphate ABC transporter ATP-binding protein [Planctomycetota bacterium]
MPATTVERTKEAATLATPREKAPLPPRLRAVDVRVSGTQGEILKGITLEARHGEILSIIGPAGAGKTTFLRALNRMNDLDPDLCVSGQVFLDGWPVYDAAVDVALLRRKVGMVFSVPVPLPMTIFRNMAFGPSLEGANSARTMERVEAALRAAYLWDEVQDRLEEPARNLSGGQQQRLCLARALVLQPDVLLLDEPCSGLDPISTAKIEEALQRLKKDLAVILVTNNVKQASRASDRTAFFLFGEMIELQPTESLFTTPQDKRTADYISGRFG